MAWPLMSTKRIPLLNAWYVQQYSWTTMWSKLVKVVNEMQSCKTMKKCKCDFSGVFCSICLKSWRLLEFPKGISLDFKFCCYGNQNEHNCLSLKKQKVYYLSNSVVQKIIWNNTVDLLLHVVSFFLRKIQETLFLLWKTIVFCFWRKAYYSYCKCQSKKILNQANFLWYILTAHKISNKSNKRILRYCTFIFIIPCNIASVTSYLRENETENLQNGDFHLPQIPNFEMRYLENHLAHWGQCGLIFLHFSCSFIWA